MYYIKNTINISFVTINILFLKLFQDCFTKVRKIIGCSGGDLKAFKECVMTYWCLTYQVTIDNHCSIFVCGPIRSKDDVNELCEDMVVTRLLHHCHKLVTMLSLARYSSQHYMYWYDVHVLGQWYRIYYANPALVTSSLMEWKQVALFPLSILAEQNIQGPWHMAATGLPIPPHYERKERERVSETVSEQERANGNTLYLAQTCSSLGLQISCLSSSNQEQTLQESPKHPISKMQRNVPIKWCRCFTRPTSAVMLSMQVSALQG